MVVYTVKIDGDIIMNIDENGRMISLFGTALVHFMKRVNVISLGTAIGNATKHYHFMKKMHRIRRSTHREIVVETKTIL